MANSFVRYTGNNSTTAYSIPFSYRTTGDLTVTLAGVATTAFTLNAAGTTLTFSSPPASNVAIEIRRTTSQTTRLTDYASGSVLTENDLDTDSEQAFFMSQEAIDDADDVIKISNVNFQYDATNKRITNVADPVNAQDLATKNYLENTFLTTANKTALTTVNANIANINAVNSNATNINSAVSNATNINTVATNIGSVNTVATDIAKVITVANDLAEAVSEVETVADDLNETSSEIEVVGGAITNVNNVGNNIANVNTVAGISANVTTVAGNNSNVSTVAGISSDVTAVAGISSDVQAVENIASNVTTVAGIASDVTSVAGISTAVSNVNSNSSNINAVNSNATNINTVAGNNSNISTVSGISGNVSTVAGISSDVTSVAGISSAVSTVSGMSTAINTANSNSSNINTVAGAITNVNNVGGSIANVNTVAGNLSGVNSFGERYRVSSSAPSTSLDVGDLYFDTTANELKVYKSSGWANAGSTVNGTSERFNYTATGGQTTFTGSDNNGNTLGYDAGFIDVYLNGSKLLNGTDVTVTSGTSVVLASGATAGDVVDIVTYGTFSVATLNADNLSSGTVPDARITGAYTGITNLTMTGDLTVDNTTGAELILSRNDTSIAVDDLIGGIQFKANDASSSPDPQICGIKAISTGATNTNPKLSFFAGESNYNADTPNMSIDANGNITMSANLTVDTDTLFVDSSNNRVGIGTTSPGFEFVVKDASGSAVIRAENGSANHIVDLIADGTGGLLRTVGSYPLVFNTNQTERARLDTSGNFMVGKTATGIGSAGAELKSDGRIFSVVSGNYAGLFNRLSSDGEIVQIRRDGTTVGSLDTVGVSTSGRLVVKSTTFDGYLDRAGTTIAKWMSSSFTPGADNTFDLGRGAERWRDLYLSGGAYIGGTGSANKLDDYEEGTWTPTFDTGELNGFSGSATVNDSVYTKIGNLCHIFTRIQFASSSGTLAVGDKFVIQPSSLPFARLTGDGQGTGSAVLHYNANGNGLASVTASGADLRIFVHNVIGSPTRQSTAYIAFTYQTT